MKNTDHPKARGGGDARRWLLVAAAEREVRCVLDGLGLGASSTPGAWGLVSDHDRFDVLCSGVGKANAAGSVARVLDPARHRGVINVGVAGSLPGSGCGLGDVLLASRSVFSDEGIGSNEGFISMAQAGFAPFPDGTMGADHDHGLLRVLTPLADHVGAVATVSWCSGADGCARGVVERTGAMAEAMEGAAVALACRRVDPHLASAELRVISNTTGDRRNQRWALEESLLVLGDVLGRMAPLLG